MLNARAIKELVHRHHLGISPRRKGQHFLVDPGPLGRIAAAVGAAPGERVLEIGSGLGALTEPLLEAGADLIAVERDPRFAGILAGRFGACANFKLVQADILDLDLAEHAQDRAGSLLVAGNIPYSITSPILEFLLRQRRWVKRAVLTVQKEVARRITAAAGTKEYSSITLLVQVAFRPAIAFTIPPACFYPQPEVTSAVLRLDPLGSPAVPPDEEEGVLQLGRRIFTHRRKTLLNALAISIDKVEEVPGLRPGTSSGALSKEELSARILRAEIDPARRPETLTIADLLRLHRALST